MEGRLIGNVPIVSDDRATFEAWTDGFAVGFKATHEDGRIEYLYLNPSTGSEGEDGANPCVFLYQGTDGAPHTDPTVCYIDMFD